jgi:DNA-directed RNA polymerase subunit RPC12/RpoP
MSVKPEYDENEPVICPYCQYYKVNPCDFLSGKTDEGDWITLQEYQCQFCGRSFWV